MNYKELIEALKSTLPQKVPYGELVGAEGAFAHSGPMVYEDPEPYFVEQAITAITDLLSRAESAESAQETLQRTVAEYKDMEEKAERERDAAIFDLLRAEEAAKETNALLDDEVHPACDYSLYLAVHDSVSDIVNWEREDVWRGKKEK